ncbi:MAG: CHAT domain-containing protein [Bacteroidia bacterium]|nr:CHAT domain-containing protein [Bacteroidia bacterium]MDW8015054.1 CHAT domain-containing protein [Bacteroidia bacterium]
MYRFGIFLGGFLTLHAQIFPYQELYFRGKIDFFGRKVTSAYRKAVRASSGSEPKVLGTTLGYALYLSETHRLREADSLLRPYAPLMEEGAGIPSELRFIYWWLQGRVARMRGFIKASFEAFRRASAQAQTPWQVALSTLEITENFLLLGNVQLAADTLASVSLVEPIEEPYASYLKAKKAYLDKVVLWQQGKWNLLEDLLTAKTTSQHQALYYAEYNYLRAYASFMQGAEKSAREALRQSVKWAKKTSTKGKDLIVRAEALRLRAYYQRTFKAHQSYKLQELSSLIEELRSPELPTTYATLEALGHVGEITSMANRNALTENLLSLRLSNVEGLRAVRFYRLAAQSARLQYKGTIAIGYANQAVQRLRGEVPFPSVEGVLSYVELGMAALSAYKYQVADSAFSQARRLLAEMGDPEGPMTLTAWNALGVRALSAGRYAEAEKLFRRQREIYQTLFAYPTKNLDYLRNALLLADLSIRLAQVAPAESLLQEVDEPIRSISGAAFTELVALEQSLGDLAQLKGQFRDAERHYIQSLRLRQRYKNERGQVGQLEESGSLLRLALLYQRTGRVSRAREVYQRITTLYEASRREDPEVAAYYTALSDFYVAVGDYLKAEESARKARELNRQLLGEISPGYIEALLASARIEGALGRYDKQKLYLQQVLQAQRQFYQGKAAIPLARTLYLLAENAFLRDQRDTGLYYLTESAVEAQRAQESAPLEYAALALDIGGGWLALDSLNQAELQIAAAKAVLEMQVPVKHPDRLRVLLYEARLKKARGEYLSALQEYGRWLNAWKSIYGDKHPEYPFHLGEMADMHWLARDFSGAKRTYEKAVSLLLNQVDRLFNGLTENEKARYWLRVRKVLEHYYSFSFLQGTDKDKLRAYEVYLTTKAFLLSETAQLRARLSTSRDTTIRRLFQEWQDQKEYVVRLYAYTPTELRELKINLSEEEERLNSIEKELTQHIGDIRLRQIRWGSLRAVLPAEGTAIDWIRLRVPETRDSIVYYAVLTLPTAKKPLFVLFPQGHLMETNGGFRYSQAILNFEKDTLSYKIYWEPIAAVLPPSVSKLFISNDGVFHQINLATIQLPQGGYVGDHYRILYHTRLANLLQPLKPLKYWEGRKAFIIADPDYTGGLPADSIYIPPLPGTLQEARAISDILQSEGIISYLLTHRQANEESLYETISPFILHIATHGLFLPYAEGIGSVLGIQSGEALANPLFRSAILLADAGRTMMAGSTNAKGDGIANAYELLSLQLNNTQLVVLSACETGLGEIQNGEGVYGLQRALLMAGARNLIVSLWRVDDEATRDFMIHFYDEWLRKKLSIEEAFWNTQRAMRRLRSSPYFWGAFVLVRS